MALIVLAFLLVLGIAFFQVIQGVFSALIMTILTILSAAVAFNYYEPLAQLLYTRQPPYADAISLAAIFVITLLALRLVFDKLVAGNVVLGVWADRIGGGALGLVTGMVCVGVLTICLQMLPFGQTVFTFRSFDDALQRKQRLAPFYPDEFTIGLVNMLSNASIAQGKPFTSTHDDLLREAYCARNTAGLFGRLDAMPDALASVQASEAPEERAALWRKDIPDNPAVGLTTLTTDVIVRCKISDTVIDPADKDALADARWCLPGSQFRLVAASGKSYYPMAYLTYTKAKSQWEAQVATLEDNVPQRGKLVVGRPYDPKQNTITVDWVYRIAKEDAPRQLVFRRVATAPLPAELQAKMPPTTDALDVGEKKRY